MELTGPNERMEGADDVLNADMSPRKKSKSFIPIPPLSILALVVHTGHILKT